MAVETREVHYVLLGLLVLNFAFNTGLEVVLSYSREREDIYRLYESLHAYRDAMAAPVPTTTHPARHQSRPGAEAE